ncbi:acyl-CoA dehydrogenase [Rhizocola hellebori]|uniref:Acyl-CoA dehydrogenase n=1 Tax=Rhizocola hellebori TaxID=1392758 RepID=A0A8J3VH87_9ACTN|nr:acyl-CoA dehydrogenase family protein [Rhizocola hellebori]GIH06250.1 acyl-CoA dehydrogenase [Rhizocola hellebori]
MDFTLDEAQEVVARVSADVLRTAAPEESWKALGQAGMLTLAAPESVGGEGLGVLEVALVLREVGRAAALVPALPHLMTGVIPVARWGTAEQQQAMLTGERLLTATLHRASYGDGVLNGTCRGVPFADTAYRMLVPIEHGIAVVDPALAHLERTVTSSGGPEFTVHLTRTPVEEVWEMDVREFEELAIAGACALGDGFLAGALELTTNHIRTREQFGKPLATFQAVAGQIADVYIASRTLHLAALSAVWRLHTGRDASSDVDIAATWLAQEAMAAMRTCHHLHGGIGLDVSYPLHRYTSMMKDLIRYVPRPV